MGYLKELGEFAWAVINNWAGYTTGGVVVALVWLWSTLKQVPVSRKVGVGLALIFLFFAFFNAWRDQYKRSHPGLSLKVETASVGYASDSPNIAKWLILASITNNGSPSIADNWRLSVLLPGRTNSIMHEFEMFRPNDPIHTEGSAGVFEYSQDDALYNKTLPQPLASGGKQTGFLMFIFPEMTMTMGAQKGTTITLECSDVFGNPIKTSYIMQGTGTTEGFPGYLPGMKAPTYKKPEEKKIIKRHPAL